MFFAGSCHGPDLHLPLDGGGWVGVSHKLEFSRNPHGRDIQRMIHVAGKNQPLPAMQK